MDAICFKNLQFRSDTGIIRDTETNKILAYCSKKNCGKKEWIVKLENFPDGNFPLKESILEITKTINGLSEITPDIVFNLFNVDFPKIFESIKSKYSLQKIEKTLLAIEVDNDDIESEQDHLLKLLSDIKIHFYKVSQPHISLSYLHSAVPLWILEEEIIKTTKKHWKFKIKSIKILPGLTTPRDYISFELTTPDDFMGFIDRIHSHAGCEKVSFPGGFKAHISLLSIDKGSLTDEIVNQINQKFLSYNVRISPTIRPTYVTLFNQNKSTEIKKKFKNIKE
jgi:hypothetical protein